jgi:hypothetical protein
VFGASDNGGNSLEIGDGSEGKEGKESSLESLPGREGKGSFTIDLSSGKIFTSPDSTGWNCKAPFTSLRSSEITCFCLGVTKGFSDNCIGDPSDLHVASFPCLVPFV